MFGISLILLLAVMGGAIAFLGDKLGSKIGKKRLTVLGLRPHYTSILMTVLSGIMVAVLTIGALTAASEEARTALFGMHKIQAEIKSLTQEKQNILAELDTQNKKVQALNEEIKRTTEELAAAKEQTREATAQRDAAIAQKAQAQQEIAQLQSQYAAAQKQVADAEGAKSKLQGEVSELETATKKLRESMTAIREGNVIYRNGEIIFAGVLKAGLNEEDNKRQLATFIATANGHVLSRMGAKDDVQAIWLSTEAVNLALKNLHEGKGDYYVRMCASGNIVSGELAPAIIELAPNKRIYDKGEVVLRQKITVTPNTAEVDASIMAFLKDVNRNAQQAGVVPDPITGRVGAIQSNDLSKISEEITRKGGRVELIAKTKEDIMIAGPVLINVDVVQRRD